MSSQLTRVVRGEYANDEAVENKHFGSVAVVDGEGDVVFSVGDLRAATHLRSTAKPFQLLPFIDRKLHQQLSDAEVALLMSSHSGEKKQVDAIAQILTKLNVKQSQLLCGIHAPTSSEARLELAIRGEKPSVLHNNCSGKHCAMVATATANGWSTDDYLDINHPLQKEITSRILEISRSNDCEIGFGIDGCSAPTFIIPLVAIARLYCALGSDELRYLYDVGVNHPGMIAGKKRLDTILMEAGCGAVFAKTGADGVYAMTVKPSDKYPTGLGIVIKVDDGDHSNRVRQFVASTLLVRLGVMEAEKLSSLAEASLKNHRGIVVGRMIADF